MPWWPVGDGDPGLMEYLTWASPPEFKSRIMTDEAPLRRATQPPVEPLGRQTRC